MRIGALRLDGYPLPAGPETVGPQNFAMVVATDAPLTRPQCRVVAKMASAAFARCFHPALTPFDGDVVFALSTGTESASPPPRLLAVGEASAEALTDAILRAVR